MECVYDKRLSMLRDSMLINGCDACVILTSDPHASEYVPGFWRLVHWISGFNGSSAAVVVTADYAGLWTDGRYWAQAEEVLESTCVKLHKANNGSAFMSWIAESLSPGSVVCTDGCVLPFDVFKKMRQIFSPCEITLRVDLDLVGPLVDMRESLPSGMVYEHPAEFVSMSRIHKIECIREQMRSLGAENHVVSSLDDIAYITNLRGSDIPYNPVFLSFLLIKQGSVVLFVDSDKVSDSLLVSLREDGFCVREYCEVLPEIRNMCGSVLIDPSRTTMSIISALNGDSLVIESVNPSTLLKSCKSRGEIANIKEAMRLDGASLCRFFMWLERKIAGGFILSELDIGPKLQEFRSDSDLYVSDSFETIAGFGKNGALPHYVPTEDVFSSIYGDGLLLVDSGAHYLNGTTDITRVVPVGCVSDDEIMDYTLTLKAHISMSSAVFPGRVSMPMLDSIGRVNLWREHIDYAHGTGHGVGYFLSVHEGPQTLSCYSDCNCVKPKEGMVISIEPGIYRQGKWGVRLENVVSIVPFDLQKNHEFGDFFRFDVLTLFPFEASCINLDMLTENEIEWLNAYHATVFEKLSGLLDSDSKEWLRGKTAPLCAV